MTKPTKWHVHPAKTQISLGIRPIWSESSLSAWRKLGSLATHWAQRRLWSDWADAQADLSLCCAHMPFCWFCHEAAHFAKFIMWWSSWLLQIFYKKLLRLHGILSPPSSFITWWLLKHVELFSVWFIGKVYFEQPMMLLKMLTVFNSFFGQDEF